MTAHHFAVTNFRRRFQLEPALQECAGQAELDDIGFDGERRGNRLGHNAIITKLAGTRADVVPKLQAAYPETFPWRSSRRISFLAVRRIRIPTVTSAGHMRRLSRHLSMWKYSAVRRPTKTSTRCRIIFSRWKGEWPAEDRYLPRLECWEKIESNGNGAGRAGVCRRHVAGAAGNCGAAPAETAGDGRSTSVASGLLLSSAAQRRRCSPRRRGRRLGGIAMLRLGATSRLTSSTSWRRRVSASVTAPRVRVHWCSCSVIGALCVDLRDNRECKRG